MTVENASTCPQWHTDMILAANCFAVGAAMNIPGVLLSQYGESLGLVFLGLGGFAGFIGLVKYVVGVIHWVARK